jgi:hypothetical protein
MCDALGYLRELGTIADLRRQAETLRTVVLPNNSHLHLPPNFSAFTTTQQAVDLAVAQGCRMVGVSNYYDYEIYADFAEAARRKNVFPLFGTEIICMIEELRGAGVKINDPGNPGKMYICGKGIVKFEHMTTEAERILGIIRKNDAERMRKMVGKLAGILAERGLPNRIDAEAVIDRVVRRHGVRGETVYLQERHVAQAVQEFISEKVPATERMGKVAALLGAAPKMKGPEDSVGLQNELRTHLMKSGRAGFVEETFIGFEAAMTLIRELGGFACYPILADGTKPMCPFEVPVDRLIDNMKERGIWAAELITGRNSVATAVEYARAVRRAGIVLTCGTEHNTLDLLGMVPVCADGDVPGELKEIFYEGACVVAAHQFLVTHGKRGYEGDRIEELARLGNAVIRKALRAF